jgi:hypothetical protein
MRRNIILAAIAVIAAITAASITMFAKPKVAGDVQAIEAPFLPHEIMVKRGSSLPIEYWAHPF